MPNTRRKRYPSPQARRMSDAAAAELRAARERVAAENAAQEAAAGPPQEDEAAANAAGVEAAAAAIGALANGQPLNEAASLAKMCSEMQAQTKCIRMQSNASIAAMAEMSKVTKDKVKSDSSKDRRPNPLGPLVGDDLDEAERQGNLASFF